MEECFLYPTLGIKAEFLASVILFVSFALSVLQYKLVSVYKLVSIS